MGLVPIGVNGVIESLVSQEELDARLGEGLVNKVVPCEQWYRKEENWLSLTAFTNPYKTVYTELPILVGAREELEPLLRERALVFYGVGTGDTEAVLVEWQIEGGGTPEVYGIDVNRKFLEMFSQTLENLSVEHAGDIRFKGWHMIFQNTSKEQFGGKEKAHICLGNTIGNFDQDEIFGILQSNASEGGLLVVGVHLNKQPEKLLRQYRDNPMVEKLVLGSFEEGLAPKVVEWAYNKEDDTVEAWGGGVQLLMSKKYNLEKLAKTADKHGFKKINCFEKGDCAVVVFEKA